VGKRLPLELLDQRAVRIALPPTSEMLDRGEPIRLVAVARAVGQHEVVAQVERIPGPGDEVVYRRGQP